MQWGLRLGPQYVGLWCLLAYRQLGGIFPGWDWVSRLSYAGLWWLWASRHLGHNMVDCGACGQTGSCEAYCLDGIASSVSNIQLCF